MVFHEYQRWRLSPSAVPKHLLGNILFKKNSHSDVKLMFETGKTEAPTKVPTHTPLKALFTDNKQIMQGRQETQIPISSLSKNHSNLQNCGTPWQRKQKCKVISTKEKEPTNINVETELLNSNSTSLHLGLLPPRYLYLCNYNLKCRYMLIFLFNEGGK